MKNHIYYYFNNLINVSDHDLDEKSYELLFIILDT